MSNYAKSPKLLALSSQVNLFHGRRRLSFLDLIAKFFFSLLLLPMYRYLQWDSQSVFSFSWRISNFPGPVSVLFLLFFFSADTGRFQTVCVDRLLLITVIFAMFLFIYYFCTSAWGQKNWPSAVCEGECKNILCQEHSLQRRHGTKTSWHYDESCSWSCDE